LTPPIERPAGACLSEPCPAGTFPQQHLAIDQPGGPSITVLAIQSIVISLTALAQGSSGTDAAAPGILEQLSAQCSFIWSAIQNTPWAFWREYAWRDYWMHSIFDDRFLVIYYLPWVLILLLLKGKALRIGIIVTSLAFLAYLHGPLYPIYWLVILLGVYAFTQRWQIESQRTDVWRGGPIVAAIVLVIGIVALTGLMESLRLNSESNTQLHERFWWLWPLAYRGAWWEPHPGAEPSQLFQHVWFNPHIIGIAYLTVRLLHYFSELRKNTIPAEERTLPRFLAYFSYAPSLIQGPIERYDKFNSEIDNCHTQRSLGMAAYGLYRIALGLSKSLISTWYFHPLVGWILSGGGIGDGAFYKTPHLIESYWLLYLGALGQIFMLYIEFSGYCDIAIGMSHIIGYRHIDKLQAALDLNQLPRLLAALAHQPFVLTARLFIHPTRWKPAACLAEPGDHLWTLWYLARPDSDPAHLGRADGYDGLHQSCLGQESRPGRRSPIRLALQTPPIWPQTPPAAHYPGLVHHDQLILPLTVDLLRQHRWREGHVGTGQKAGEWGAGCGTASVGMVTKK
jgi:D-alanyl-lipoteichoic acid acyltransferase DltB (MBOAT superfamily)